MAVHSVKLGRGGGGGGFILRNPPDEFTGTTIATARTARNTYFNSNSNRDDLREFQNNPNLAIILKVTGATNRGNHFQIYTSNSGNHDASKWLDVTGAIQGNKGDKGDKGDPASNATVDARIATGVEDYARTGVTGTMPGTRLRASSVTAAKIATDAVQTAKIQNEAVTKDKLGDDAVETAKIKNDAVTLDKLAPGTANKFIGFDGSGNPVEKNAPAGGGNGGTTTVDQAAIYTALAADDVPEYSASDVNNGSIWFTAAEGDGSSHPSGRAGMVTVTKDELVAYLRGAGLGGGGADIDSPVVRSPRTTYYGTVDTITDDNGNPEPGGFFLDISSLNDVLNYRVNATTTAKDTRFSTYAAGAGLYVGGVIRFYKDLGSNNILDIEYRIVRGPALRSGSTDVYQINHLVRTSYSKGTVNSGQDFSDVHLFYTEPPPEQAIPDQSLDYGDTARRNPRETYYGENDTVDSGSPDAGGFLLDHSDTSTTVKYRLSGNSTDQDTRFSTYNFDTGLYAGGVIRFYYEIGSGEYIDIEYRVTQAPALASGSTDVYEIENLVRIDHSDTTEDPAPFSGVHVSYIQPQPVPAASNPLSIASRTDALYGVGNDGYMTAQRTKQAIDSQVSRTASSVARHVKHGMIVEEVDSSDLSFKSDGTYLEWRNNEYRSASSHESSETIDIEDNIVGIIIGPNAAGSSIIYKQGSEIPTILYVGEDTYIPDSSSRSSIANVPGAGACYAVAFQDGFHPTFTNLHQDRVISKVRIQLLDDTVYPVARRRDRVVLTKAEMKSWLNIVEGQFNNPRAYFWLDGQTVRMPNTASFTANPSSSAVRLSWADNADVTGRPSEYYDGGEDHYSNLFMTHSISGDIDAMGGSTTRAVMNVPAGRHDIHTYIRSDLANSILALKLMKVQAGTDGLVIGVTGATPTLLVKEPTMQNIMHIVYPDFIPENSAQYYWCVTDFTSDDIDLMGWTMFEKKA